MSKPRADHISPVTPDLFLQLQLPRVQFAIRTVMALLALIYAWAVPAKLVLTTYPLFLVSLVIWYALQCLLPLSASLYGTRRGLLISISLVDLIGAVALISNDPAAWPPSLLTLPVALLLAAAQHPLRTWAVLAGTGLIASATCLSLQRLWLGQLPDFGFWANSIALLVLLATITLIAWQLEQLRLSTDRVTATDPLSGLGNRWTFYEAAKYLSPLHHRDLTPLVVMYADIEFTRKGRRPLPRPIRELCLKQFANLVDQRLRRSDIAVRYGKTDFAFLLMDATTKDAEAVAHDLQHQFSQWARQKDLPAWAHIGVAVVPQHQVAIDQILININAALYRARQYKKGVTGAVFADPDARS